MSLDRFKFDHRQWRFRFSVCTMVSDAEQYLQMKESFVAAGFSEEDTEYLLVDNSKGNVLDAFAGYNQFLNRAQGEYIILCHQDVLLDFDKRDVLEQRLAELDKIDPAWALAGNAGAKAFGRNVVRITDPYATDLSTGTFPEKVQSLDENFIVVRNDANLAVSHDLEGFHLYGPDLCLVADILGRNSYVIDFHLRHLSAGKVDERFYRVRDAMVRKYQRALRPRFLQTMIERFYLSGGLGIISSVLNRKWLLKLLKSLNKRFTK